MKRLSLMGIIRRYENRLNRRSCMNKRVLVEKGQYCKIYDRYAAGPVKADYEYGNKEYLQMAAVNGALYGF